MRKATLLLTMTALLLIGAAAPATADETIPASGEFRLQIDLSTLTVEPVRDACRLTVAGLATFTGTLEGTAAGTTTALVFAPCDQVATAPPGTFADVFRSRLRFEGTVDGVDTTARILWLGFTRPGGQSSGVMLVDGDRVEGRLRVDSVVGEGGGYEGTLTLD